MTSHRPPSLIELLESVGLGERMEKTLRGRGVNSVSALHAFGLEGLQTVDGIRAVQRRALVTRANEVMNGTWQHAVPVTPAPPPLPTKRQRSVGGGIFGLFGTCGCSGEVDSPVPHSPPSAAGVAPGESVGQDSSAALEAALKAALQGALDIEENQLKEALMLEAEWKLSEGWQARFAAAEKSDDYDWMWVIQELQCEVLQAVGLTPSQETLDRFRAAALRYPELGLPRQSAEPEDDLHALVNSPRTPAAHGLTGLVQRAGQREESMGSFGAHGYKRYSSEVYDSVGSDTPPDETLQFAVSRSMSDGMQQQTATVAGEEGGLGVALAQGHGDG